MCNPLTRETSINLESEDRNRGPLAEVRRMKIFYMWGQEIPPHPCSTMLTVPTAKEKCDDNLVFQQCPWLEAIQRDNCSDTLSQVLNYTYLVQCFKVLLQLHFLSENNPSKLTICWLFPHQICVAKYPPVHTASAFPLLSIFIIRVQCRLLTNCYIVSHRYQTMNRGSLSFFCSSFYREYVVDIQEAWVVRLIHAQPINLGEMTENLVLATYWLNSCAYLKILESFSVSEDIVIRESIYLKDSLWLCFIDCSLLRYIYQSSVVCVCVSVCVCVCFLYYSP